MSDKLMISEIRRIYSLFQNLTARQRNKELTKKLNVEFSKLFDENGQFNNNYNWESAFRRDWYLDDSHICRITIEYPHEKIKDWIIIIGNIHNKKFINTIYLYKFIKFFIFKKYNIFHQKSKAKFDMRRCAAQITI